MSDTILLNVLVAAAAIDFVPPATASLAVVDDVVAASSGVGDVDPIRCLRMARTSARMRVIMSKLKKLNPMRTAIITIDQKCDMLIKLRKTKVKKCHG